MKKYDASEQNEKKYIIRKIGQSSANKIKHGYETHRNTPRRMNISRIFFQKLVNLNA